MVLLSAGVEGLVSVVGIGFECGIAAEKVVSRNKLRSTWV